MTTSLPQTWCLPRHVHEDICDNAETLVQSVSNVTEEAILHGKTRVGSERVDEVATLAWFFVHGLPRLQQLWNQRLTSASVRFKGIFCHRSGVLGPVVQFGSPSRRCELADLLIVVTCAGSMPGGTTGNAVFLQAKAKREPLSGTSTEKQIELYGNADTFTFVAPKSAKAASSAFPSGVRTMPDARDRGFKFWFYERARYFRFLPFYWHTHPHWQCASTTADARNVDHLALDGWFPTTLVDVVTGRDGLGFCPPAATDSGWNQIVRDSIALSVGRALAVPHKIDAKNVTRTIGAVDLAVLLQDSAAVSNPFDGLDALFDDEALKSALASLANKKSIDPKTTESHPNSGPPNWTGDVGDEDSGGGSFIWINIVPNEKRR